MATNGGLHPGAHSVSFDLRVFSTGAVKKAAYVFIDRFAAAFAATETTLVCSITFLNSVPEGAKEKILLAFQQEVLDYDLRESIGNETANVRNAILALALQPSGLLK